MTENSDLPGEVAVVYVSLTGAGQPGLRFRYRGLSSWLAPVWNGNDFGVERFVYVGGQDIPQKTGEGV
jgi:hypothetical protein